MTALFHPQTIAEIVAHVEQARTCIDAPEGFKPTDGWHTIEVGSNRDEVDTGSLATWLRLFEMYAVNRKGTVIWRDVIHFDREKRQVSATLCIIDG